MKDVIQKFIIVITILLITTPINAEAATHFQSKEVENTTSNIDDNLKTTVKTYEYEVENNDDWVDNEEDDIDTDTEEEFDEKNYAKYFTISNDGTDDILCIDGVPVTIKPKSNYQIRIIGKGDFVLSKELCTDGAEITTIDMKPSISVEVYDKNHNYLGTKKFEKNTFNFSSLISWVEAGLNIFYLFILGKLLYEVL